MTWRNTVIVGPGVHDWVMDTIELGPRVSMRWASGRIGVGDPKQLRRMDPPPHYPQRGQLELGAR